MEVVMQIRKHAATLGALGFCLALFVTTGTIRAEAQEQITPLPGMTFVSISPGSFTMGSPEDEEGREADEVQHQVTISQGFSIQTTEVTVGQWRTFVEETGYESTAEKTGAMALEDGEWKVRKGYDWKNPGFPQSDNHPVTCVSWDDTKAFAEWLSEKAGGTFRLPTEAEWEYACRAGTTTRFHWGDKMDCDKANFGNSWSNECGRKEPLRTVQVASYPPNAWGLYDMHGNVWEWTNDWFAPYQEGSATDPKGPEWGERRSVRSGSWWSYSRYCRSAVRVRNSPDQAFQTLGFRLVRTP
jgi:formylglycine-generating enzyme required for sulfatase activity